MCIASTGSALKLIPGEHRSEVLSSLTWFSWSFETFENLSRPFQNLLRPFKNLSSRVLRLSSEKNKGLFAQLTFDTSLALLEDLF